MREGDSFFVFRFTKFFGNYVWQLYLFFHQTCFSLLRVNVKGVAHNNKPADELRPELSSVRQSRCRRSNVILLVLMAAAVAIDKSSNKNPLCTSCPAPHDRQTSKS